MNSIIDIKVLETPVLVKDSSDESWKVVPEFNIKVETDQYTLYIVRYIPDFHCFDKLVKMYYHKTKISFPRLTAISKAEKRISIRTLFHRSLKSKTNAEKVEKYLHRCSINPILKTSSLLRDFFSPQRENDFKSLQRQHRDDSSRSISPEPTHNSTDSDGSISSFSLPAGRESERESYDENEHDENVDPHNTVPFWRNSIASSEHEFAKRSSSISESKKTDDFFNKGFIDRSEFLLDNLEMIKVLGRGCMGKVLLVKSKNTKRYYALKSIVKDHVVEQREITHTLDEQDILSSLSQMNHPFLTKLHAAFQDEYRLYLLTDYYSGGDLATHMARFYSFPKECALVYAAEIIEGIGELHSLGILYRDLKPENILLSAGGHIILTDFGLSKWLTESNGYSTQTFCGTAEYLAPEILLGEDYSFGVDHWSFGTILYEMLTGVPPFWADNHPEMYRRILEDPLEFPNDIVDYETAEFLTFILDKDPRTRLGVNGTDEIKSHAFFADIDWDELRNRQIEPLYVPVVNDELDFRNFDPDFLSMDPALTPVPSEINLILELEDIFGGYSFTDAKYAEDELNHDDTEEAPLDGETAPQNNDDDFLEDLDSTLVSRPSRKRGSFSMLSEEDELYIKEKHNKHIDVDLFQNEENNRYAKRRNTGSIEKHISFIDNISKKTEKNDTTKKANKKTDDTSSLNNIRFSNSPDLRFSFSLDDVSSQSLSNASKKVKKTKSDQRNKIRRFFSLIL